MWGGSGSDRTVVVGRLREDTLELLRVRYGADGAPSRALATAMTSWESGVSLGEPLERLLGWRPSEPVIVAPETPPVVGGTVPAEAAVTAEGAGKERARAAAARWVAREHMLEVATHYFDCTLESVRVLTEMVPAAEGARRGELTTVIVGLAPAAADLEVLSPPPDVPHFQLILLPLLLGELIGRSEQRSETEVFGLLTVEERQLSYGVWSGGVPRVLRNLPLGGELLGESVAAALQCSPREARALLLRAEDGTLSPAAARALARVIRTLLPLFSGAFQVLSWGVHRADLPERLSILGCFGGAFLKMCCRLPFIARCAQPTVKIHVLRSPAVLEERILPDLPSRALLRWMAAALAPEPPAAAASATISHAARVRPS